MGGDWRRQTLRDAGVTLIDCDHRTPPATDSGRPYVAIPQLSEGRIDLKTARRISEADFIEWTKKARPTTNDVVLSRRCNPGETAFVPEGIEFALGQNLVLLRSDAKKLFPPYLRWLTRGPEWWAQIGKFLNVGAVFDSLKCADIPNFELNIPPLQEQRAIAHILGTLDRKIDLNGRTRETLEAMARALFTSWFTDFEPVRADAEGSTSLMPRTVVDLFPKSFESSELGDIPKNWKVIPLGEICRRVAMGPFGSDIKTDNFVESGVPVVRGSNLTRGFVEDSFVFVSEQKADELRNANAFRGDIVITHRGTLGQVGLIPESSRFPRYVVSQSQMLLSVNRDVVTPRYVHAYLTSASGQHALLANTSQTGVPAIARPTTSVKAIRVLLPPPEVLSKFSELVQPLFARRDQASSESGTLSALRDTLLPKLISGELRVKDAEKIAARAL